MYERSVEEGVYTPAELAVLSRAFERTCRDCNLTGAPGRQLLAKSLLTGYRRCNSEEELVELGERLVWRWRGLPSSRSIVI